MNSIETRTIVTGVLCYLVRQSNGHREICLAEKASTVKSEERGIAGMRIGYGGDRTGDWESYEDAAIRKIFEESGVAAEAKDLKRVAAVDFDRPEFVYRCHHFFVEGFSGEPRPSRQMLDPQWYSIREIPYHLMDPSSVRVLPFAISGKLVQGTVLYDPSGKVVNAGLSLVKALF